MSVSKHVTGCKEQQCRRLSYSNTEPSYKQTPSYLETDTSFNEGSNFSEKKRGKVRCQTRRPIRRKKTQYNAMHERHEDK